MASRSHLDDDDDFGGDYAVSHSGRISSGEKRAFGDLDEEEDDVFGTKKGKSNIEESGPGAATGMILSLRESLQNCKNDLATCQAELEAARVEIQKWHSAFQNSPALPFGSSPEPTLVVTYLQNLKSSEDSLKEQLEKAKKREAAFIVTVAKRDQEIADLKSAVRDLKRQLQPPSMQTRRLLLDPAIHEEFMRLKNLVEEKEKKVKELQDNLAAVNFTANSRLGKMLMAKCRTLQEENEEIGAVASEGKIHEMGMKIAVLKTQNAELKNQFEALYKHTEVLATDLDTSNEVVGLLQEKLEEKNILLKKLIAQNEPKDDTNDPPASEEKSDHETEIVVET
ncbi:FKBP12-interacting protein of 37 kDa [Phalaenopsis equestris]|uniref:FKBP12-interacting protein of 37 kDa n=1 Tax=Phalaenopsis equestris TaxID=78828 RepID=UPI0009E4C769|nr:FKBP12-interacting protein of 37 kDa [Phalaenopsis equestris]